MNNKYMNNKTISRSDIKCLLRSIGCYSCYNGFEYLTDLILLTLQEYKHNKPIKINRAIYDIACKYDIKSSTIEADIRSIIRRSWIRSNGKSWEKITNIEINNTPTIKESVYLICEYLDAKI